MNHELHQGPKPPEPFWRSRTGIVFAAFAAVAVFFLVIEHQAHVLGALPYLLVVACLALHLSGHGGHGGRGDKE